MRFIPHQYQQRMIEMIETDQSVACWAEMGLGKTITVLTALNDRIFDRLLPTKALILAPKLVAEETWPSEVRKWDHLRDLRISIVAGTAQNRAVALEKDADLYIMCRNNLPWLFGHYTASKSGKWKWVKPWPFNIVVIDEASAFKNPSGTWFKTMARIARSGCQIVELTGTPSPKGLEDLWAQGFLLDRGERLGTGIGRYRDNYLMPDKMIYQAGRQLVTSYKARPGAYEEVMGLMADRCVSLRAEDWLQMPDRIDNIITVRLPDKARKLYDQMEEEAVVELSGSTVTAGSAATVIGKLLQMANGRVYDEEKNVIDVHTAKLEALREAVESATSPILAFYSYKHDLEVILREIKGSKALTIDLIPAWNRGEIPLLLAHPASAGHGLNLQAGGSNVLWFGMPYNAELYLQANARLYRQGQSSPSVIIHHIVAEGTVDEAVVEALTRKIGVQDTIMDYVRCRS